MPSENFLLIQMHELLMYLNERGVLTLMVLAQHGLLGSAMQTPVDVTYLADTVIVLRYFEAFGEVRQALAVSQKALRKSRAEHPGVPAVQRRDTDRRPAQGLRRSADRRTPIYR